MNKKRLLITGVSGLLGSNLAYCLKDRYEILGLHHDQPVSIQGIETRHADLRYKLHTESIIKRFNPDVLLHAAAQANVDACEADPQMAYAVNVQGTKNIVDILGDLPTKLIYISTDLVYDGVRGNCSENDVPGPRSCYAVTKLEGEKAALARSGALVLRTNFFGWDLFNKRSLAEWVIEELRALRPVQGYTDEIFSSIFTFDFAELVDKVIRKDLVGIYNCASRTALSKYDFLVAVAKGAGLDSSMIQPVSLDAAGLKAMRSKDLSLDVSRVSRDLGVRLPSIEDSIAHFLQGLDKNYRELIIGRTVTGQYYPFQDKIPYGRQCLDDDDIKAVVDVLRTGNLTQGPKIEEFERLLVDITGASFSAAVNSATSALHVACLAADVGPGDEVITSTNTFVASANCALYCGAKPVFTDIDPRTYNMDPTDLERKITARTKAVIPVHFAGQSCDMETVSSIVKAAEKKLGHKIFIIEDASHALGSIYKGGQVGGCACSDMAVMSFHPVKHITTGEGGALLASDQALHRKFCYLRSHGITGYPDELMQKDEAFERPASGEEENFRRNPWYYEQQWLGHNYRITDIQCALGVTQLAKLPGFIKRRREIVQAYKQYLNGIPGITIPYESPDNQSNFHLFVLLIDFNLFQKSRADVMNTLREKGIGTQVHYIPVHTQPYYQKNLGTRWGDHPRAENYYRRCLSIPLYPAMTDEDVSKVIKALKESLGLV
jgi:UDP-4-amino-4,6-dideoxy-N-acetyl-beta-L-altrosamine transaminase/dTDP-4-dehydrorhamnose reductase